MYIYSLILKTLFPFAAATSLSGTIPTEIGFLTAMKRIAFSELKKEPPPVVFQFQQIHFSVLFAPRTHPGCRFFFSLILNFNIKNSIARKFTFRVTTNERTNKQNGIKTDRFNFCRRSNPIRVWSSFIARKFGFA